MNKNSTTPLNIPTIPYLPARHPYPLCLFRTPLSSLPALQYMFLSALHTYFLSSVYSPPLPLCLLYTHLPPTLPALHPSHTAFYTSLPFCLLYTPPTLHALHPQSACFTPLPLCMLYTPLCLLYTLPTLPALHPSQSACSSLG